MRPRVGSVRCGSCSSAGDGAGIAGREESCVTALLRALAQPLYVEGSELTPHVRVGIALLPGDGRTGDELCRRARAALAGAASAGTQVAWFAGLDE